MHMRNTLAVAYGAAMLPFAAAALAVQVEDYVAMRILEPPAVHPPPDCLNVMAHDQPCGAGPAYVVGISNVGDMFGILATNHPHVHHNEEAIRWLRNTGYTGENVHRPEMAPELGLPGGLASGIHMGWVSAGGLATGVIAVTNTASAAYDVANNQWWHLGPGGAMKGNDLGRVVVVPTRFTQGRGQVRDISLVEPPFTLNETGELQTLAVGAYPVAINNQDIIVGSFDTSCLPTPTPVCFNKNAPMKLLPTGENTWGQPIVMQELLELSPSTAGHDRGSPAAGGFGPTDLSNTDPAYAIGTSRGKNNLHGVVWNVGSGQILADLGPMAEPYRINSAGTIIVGTQQTFTFPPSREHMVWWSEDGWATVKELDINEVLKVVPGGESWEQITKLSSVNDHGQISGQGILMSEFGQLAEPDITAWDPELATGLGCGNHFWASNDGCGIPFVLDTLPLNLVGDVNNDGSIDNLDITPFIAALAAEDEAAFLTQLPEGNYTAADIDVSGSPDNLDITPFIDLLASGASNSPVIPEPAAFTLLLPSLIAVGRTRRKRL